MQRHLRPGLSPLDLPNLLTQPGEVLGELHHHDDDGASGQHAGRPQQRVEDDGLVVESRQEDGVLLLAGVVVARHLRVHLQSIRDVHDCHVHGRTVFLAPGHVEALPGVKTTVGTLLCIQVVLSRLILMSRLHGCGEQFFAPQRQTIALDPPVLWFASERLV